MTGSLLDMKVHTYLRVSTDDQTIEPQRLELERYCALKGWTIEREWSDVISGSKLSRAGLDGLLAEMRAGRVQAIMAVKIDRIARSLSNFATIIAELEKRGVALIIPGQNIDTSDASPTGKLMRGLLSIFAEFERDLIIQRTKAGLAAAKAKGVKLGHPSTRLPGNWPEIVSAWRTETGGTHIRDLATRLGGVSVSTAFRLSKPERVAA